MNTVSYFTVTAEVGAGQRIDNFLLRRLKSIPKTKVYSILRKGEVRVNKGRIKPSYKLQANDIIRVPPLTTAEQRQVTPKQVANINLEILYEDDNLLIINKPIGLAVHGGSGLSFGLIELLRAQRPAAKILELVHRLDRDTSGCVMVAKTNAMLRGLHDLLLTGKIKKIYHCLVKGYAPDKFMVDVPLLKYGVTSGERVVKVHPDGKQAVTEFTVLERYAGTTLLEAVPVTGRTHQIRVHAAHRGLPIIGDEKYGKLQAKRLFLHAYQLKFICPVTNTQIVVFAQYDQLWQEGILHYGRR